MDSALGSLSDHDLVPIVEELLSDGAGRQVRVAKLQARESDYRNLFPTTILEVELEHEPPLSLFVKHLGNEEADHPDKQIRDREVLVYQDLLTDEDLPVPRFYGARWNEITDRTMLFLEYLDGWKLKYHRPSYWVVAAERLADLHSRIAVSGRLPGTEFLIDMDREYFISWAHRAMTALTADNAAAASEFAPVLDEYEQVAGLLASQPNTLVHNDLGPKNVLARIEGDPPWVCFVDWEMAGVGCGLLDLAHLTYDRLAPGDERQVIDRYLECLDPGLLPGDENDVALVLRACDIHTEVYRIAHSRYWGESAAHTTWRVARVRALGEALLR